ncbi:putative CTD small phosphatase-like protein 2 [Hibiscus syriacus]|uniref:CTD small phosphatase-like protein 2 n=1 Tax=Hibiscus syriacus TaxID=106335 RepID=A0A6A3D0F8_HIBSY|nr:putative CTD small phosphatase-like protein 2 [Hibiscus syriacus]
MANMGENRANGSGNIQQDNNLEELFNNAGFDNSQNIVEAGEEDPVGGFQAALMDEIEAADYHLGLDQPPEMNPEENAILHGNEEFSSPSLYNPQSPQNSPGSESSTNAKPDQMNRASDLLMAVSIGAELNKNKIIEQAIGAMDELVKMATMGEPLWQRQGNGGTETLNGIQYLREFGCFDATMEDIIRMVEIGEPELIPSFDYFPPDNPTPTFLKPEFEPLNIEASRDTGLVNMNAMNIVELLMDSKNWSMVFSSIVSRATLLGVILDTVDGSCNGVLQVMTAEFHQSTPLIPTRQSYFARYCKMVAHGTWGVVDVSLENLFPCPQIQFKRRPSGCLVQQVPNNGGASNVTWVEHVEVDKKSLHPHFRPIVNSGFAFSAKRWIAVLHRHCQWVATCMATTTPTDAGVLIPQPGRESMLKVAEKMTRKFFMNISSCTENAWMGLPSNFGAEDVRFRFGNTLTVPGKPPSNTLIITTSVQVPVPVNVLFDFLRNEHSRHKWDLLSKERLVRELAYVITGENPQNRVSVLQVNSSPNKIEILYLQESYTDETGSYIVFTPMDTFAMSLILNGGNPNDPCILSSGFAILPDKPPGQGDGPEGSILTVAFQSADNLSSNELIPALTLKTIDVILSSTVASIRDAMVLLANRQFARN